MDKRLLVGCVGSETRMAQSQKRLWWSSGAWGGKCGPCPDNASYTLAFALQLRKFTENLYCNRKALDWSAPNAIRLADLAIAGDGLEWPARSYRPWLTRQETGQPSVIVSIFRIAVQGGSTRQLTLSRSSQSGLWCGRRTAEHTGPRVSACYLRNRGHQTRGEDCNTCSLRAADLHARHAKSITGGWAAFI